MTTESYSNKRNLSIWFLSLILWTAIFFFFFYLRVLFNDEYIKYIADINRQDVSIHAAEGLEVNADAEISVR